MSMLIPYLNFDGNCKEAMQFYKECLDAELVVQTVAESPMADQMSPEMKDLVLHARLEKGNIIIMASDAMDKTFVHGSMVTLMIQCDSEDEIQAYFEKLAVDGVIHMPLTKQFWGATYGQVTDKFGVLWALNYEVTQG